MAFNLPLWAWWTLILIGIIFAFYVWYKLPMLLKLQLKKLLNIKILAPIIFILVWIIWYKQDIIINENQANWWMPMFILFALMIYNVLGSWKYQTKQIVTTNFHGSYTKAYHINGFVILNIGGISADVGVKIPVADKILVIREETFALMEDGAVSIARVSPVSIYELDPDVKNYIEKTWYLKSAKQRIFYGWFDEINRVDFNDHQLDIYERMRDEDFWFELLKKEFGTCLPNPLELYRQLKEISKTVNVKTEEMEHVIETKDDSGEFYRRQKKLYNDEKKAPPEKVEGYEG